MGIFGVIFILGVAYLLSSNRKAINLRIVGAAFRATGRGCCIRHLYVGRANP